MVDGGKGADKTVHDGDVIANIYRSADSGVFNLAVFSNGYPALDVGVFVGLAVEGGFCLGVEQVSIGFQPVAEFSGIKPFAMIFFNGNVVSVVN